jgi:hypothetical protein
VRPGIKQMMFNIASRKFNVDIDRLTYGAMSYWNECHELMAIEEKKELNKGSK